MRPVEYGRRHAEDDAQSGVEGWHPREDDMQSGAAPNHGERALPLRSLARLAERPRRRIVGLMSGTSADGIDACLATFSWQDGSLHWSLDATASIPYEHEFRNTLLELAGPSGTVERLCRVGFELGARLAGAVKELCRVSGLEPGLVDLVASHGHTVRHLPSLGATLQAGEAAVIADVLGLPVVSDFRTADVAAGGEGAPLVPVADRLLFSKEAEDLVIVNIGGMANITYLPPIGSPRRIVAFDTGPGNVLMDLAVSRITGGRLECDRDGNMASGGKVNQSLLEWCMSHPFIRRRPPKSTGREEFGPAFLDELTALPQARRLAEQDLLATLCEFTARSIAGAVERHCPVLRTSGRKDRRDQGDEHPCPGRTTRSSRPSVLVAGGGARNGFLVSRLAACLPGFDVSVLGGTPGELSDNREALCFALLGELFIQGMAGASPEVTGASRPAILGKLSLPPNWARSPFEASLGARIPR